MARQRNAQNSRNSNGYNRRNGSYGSGNHKRADRRRQPVEDIDHAPLHADRFRTTSRVKETVPFVARTARQQRYYDSIMTNDLTFGLGPEGTGKTFVALKAGCQLFREGVHERLICARATVGADEDPGFYPGDPLEKITPWLLACREILDMEFGKNGVESMVKNGRIVFMPFALMRGINWRDAFVILDEAQNTTPKQMRLFLTRHVTGSRLVVEGGLGQKDTADSVENGLADAIDRLKGAPRVGTVEFTNEDITRSSFVRMVVNAYDKPSAKLRTIKTV